MTGPQPLIKYEGQNLLPGTIIQGVWPFNMEHPLCSRCSRPLVILGSGTHIDKEEVLYFDCKCNPRSSLHERVHRVEPEDE
jgi:hypothetical protein